jgi:hypothetical protein
VADAEPVAMLLPCLRPRDEVRNHGSLSGTPRRFASGRWSGGRVCRGLQAVAGRRCASALSRQGQGGRRLREGSVGRAEGGVRVWGTGGIGRNGGCG